MQSIIYYSIYYSRTPSSFLTSPSAPPTTQSHTQLHSHTDTHYSYIEPQRSSLVWLVITPYLGLACGRGGGDGVMGGEQRDGMGWAGLGGRRGAVCIGLYIYVCVCIDVCTNDRVYILCVRINLCVVYFVLLLYFSQADLAVFLCLCIFQLFIFTSFFLFFLFHRTFVSFARSLRSHFHSVSFSHFPFQFSYPSLSLSFSLSPPSPSSSPPRFHPSIGLCAFVQFFCYSFVIYFPIVF